ncbi:MAG: ATP-binding domain-containing protein, partial [Kangiellaceae bacterium]|nr:ATP-binding domain-containing protein [Kangiellaceae bacterium]
LIKHGVEEFHALPLSEQMQLTIQAVGLDTLYAKEKGEKALARKENLAELASAAREFDVDDYPDLAPMTAFLAHASLEAGDNQAEQYEDCVQMMTLHSAKGLEYPLVFIAGMEEKLFPHAMSMDEPDKLEEERRLAYVGITRAMKKLYLIHTEKRRLYGKETYPAVSRFIKEIPAQVKHDVRLNAQISQQSYQAEAMISSSTGNNTSEFRLGQMVEHPKFGTGVILNCEGEGSQARVQVNFDSVGSKWLVLAYARLTGL